MSLSDTTANLGFVGNPDRTGHDIGDHRISLVIQCQSSSVQCRGQVLGEATFTDVGRFRFGSV